MKLHLNYFALCFTGLITFFSGNINAQVGTWSALATVAPGPSGGGMLLLSDGSVIVKSENGGGDGIGNTWYKLKPNINGSYINGTWSAIAPMIDTRLYFSSQVLKDGRVYVAGGEYGTGGFDGEVYNPVTNTWSATPAPVGYISDANSEILEDGRVLQAMVNGNLKTTKIYNPVTNTYTNGPQCIGVHNESAWLKLKDNSVLMVDRLSTNSERYIPSANQWTVDAIVPVNLYDPFGDETGGALLLPDGRAWFIGSPPTTALYTPSGNNSPGSWSAGAPVPNGRGCTDAAAAMMVNGKILTVASPSPVSGNVFQSPSYFYEYDYISNSYSIVPSPGGGTYSNQPCYIFNMINLPNGQVLMARQDTDKYYVYIPSGAPLAAGVPTIGTILQNGCNSFTITGKLFNGISQGSTYGDDWQNSTNYPIVRLTLGSNVYYARTFNWNSTGVQRGNAADTAQFTLPVGLPIATYSLVVVANGISSLPVPFTPYPSLSSALFPAAICSGDVFTYTPTGFVPGSTFVWTRPAVIGITNTAIVVPQIPNPNEALINITTNPINVIYDYSTTANGCTINQPVAVLVNPLPTLAVFGTTICTGNSATLNVIGNGISTYTWSNAVVGNSIVVNPTVTTVYSVTQTNVFACAGSAQAIVQVNPLPIASIAGPSVICMRDSITLIASGGVTYTWSNASTNDTLGIFPSVTTTYTVQVSDLFGCIGTGTILVNVNDCVGVKELGKEIEDNAAIYPNPAEESLTLNFTTKQQGKFIVKLFDVYGRMVKEENNEAVTGNNSHIISLSGIAKGVYMVVLQKGSDVFKTRLLVK